MFHHGKERQEGLNLKGLHWYHLNLILTTSYNHHLIYQLLTCLLTNHPPLDQSYQLHTINTHLAFLLILLSPVYWALSTREECQWHHQWMCLSATHPHIPCIMVVDKQLSNHNIMVMLCYHTLLVEVLHTDNTINLQYQLHYCNTQVQCQVYPPLPLLTQNLIQDFLILPCHTCTVILDLQADRYQHHPCLYHSHTALHTKDTKTG